MALNKIERRKRAQRRVRAKVKGTPIRPRLSVYRSNKAIYCQLIDDVNGVTIASASSADLKATDNMSKVEQAKEVGKLISQRVGDNYEAVVFDRSGYKFHGRIAAIAEGAREGGLKF